MDVSNSNGIFLVKGSPEIPGNERADARAAKAAEKTATWSPFISLAHLRLQISQRHRTAKIKWYQGSDYHGS
jgi:hypothetical protein